MKRVWLSGLVATILVACALGYYQYKRQQLKVLEKHVVELATPRQPSVAVIDPTVDDIFTFDETIDSNPLNLDDESLSEKECCPDEEFDELLNIHITSDNNLDVTLPLGAEGDSLDDGLTPEERTRLAYIKKYGDSPAVHTYVDLLNKMMNNEGLSFQEMLTFARLDFHLNPSEESKAFLDSMEEEALIPEHLRTWEVIE